MVTVKDLTECNEWKTCTKCGEEKKIVMFSKMRDKHRPECKDCDSKAYYRRKAKKEIQAMSKPIEHKPSLLTIIINWILG